MLLKVLLGAAFVGLVLTNVVLTSALQTHRTDVPRTAPPGSGPSWSWQLNLFVYATYDPRGQAIRRWILGLLVAQAVVGMAWVVAFVAT
jgi:hypothetical protein